MRVALYARVSTEEQARSGLSIDTQLDNLRRWAAERGHVVAGEYVDPGVSARKDDEVASDAVLRPRGHDAAIQFHGKRLAYPGRRLVT